MTLHDFHRPLGKTGFKVSPLGLGTVKLGRDQGVKYPNGFTIPDDKHALALLNQARDLGINLLDTAPAYGISEERLGYLLQGQRDDWIIVSKVGEEFIEGESAFDFSAAHTRFSVDRSLQRLRTDHIELVLVHSNGDDVAILQHEEVYDTLAALKQEGKIGGFGFSGKTSEGGILALEQGDCAMVTYNLNERDEHICLADGIDPVQASFSLIFAHPAVTSAIVGTITPQHLQSNAACVAEILRQQAKR